MDKPDGYSLQRRLLVRLWVPLFIVLMLGATVAFGLARHFGYAVHDRWLYDSAMSLATQLKSQDGHVTLNLPKSAVKMFEWDSVDRIYEEVISHKQGHIFSNAVFPTPPGDAIAGEPRYYDGIIDGRPVRIVAVMLPNPADSADVILIQVAETMKKRNALVTEIIMLSVPLQMGILVLAGALVWFAVKSGLRALDDLAIHLSGYQAESLVPLSDIESVPSEVKPLVKAINQLITKLSDAQDMQRRFIANAAHQLRTPLATLQIQSERALREHDSTKHSEALSHVLTAVTRLRHVAHQLLTLTRSDQSSEPSLKMVPVDLAELVRDELERWADAAIARNIDLGYDGPEKNIEIRGEPNLLRELIGNLVDNAIRYGRPGGKVTLVLRAAPVTLCVDDDGPGIPMEERALVLERFYRRPDTTKDGCGLGLAIAREIAARHGARLSIVDNPQGGGTRVEVIFLNSTVI
jgi:two-component system sensor histidine kinase TctE